MPDPGDIVQALAPQAGYPKWHLCLCDIDGEVAACFLFLNSNEDKVGFLGDFECPDTDFPFLPKSPTGKTIISCSSIVRMNARQLQIYNANVVGRLPVPVAIRFRSFVETTRTLSRKDKAMVLAALDLVIGPPAVIVQNIDPVA